MLQEKWLKKTKDFIKYLEHEKTPYSCAYLFEKFWSEMIREETSLILRCSKDSQEFEKFLENLRMRFCDEDGAFKETEFLITNFNEEQAADHEELAFESLKFAEKLKEYLSMNLITSKKLFKKELSQKKTELEEFSMFLEILVGVNKEVIIVKERFRLIIEDDSISEKRVEDGIRVI